MNLRAIGCGVVGAAVFVALGLVGVFLALRDAEGCPASLQWAERTYRAVGTPAPSPDVGGQAVYIGSTFFGPTTRKTYGPPGSSPSTDAAARPALIALDCNDGSYQAYRWEGTLPAATASPG